MLARRALLAAGHTEAPESEADLHVINTCCITAEAEAKSRQSVRRSVRSAQQVFVGGCAVNLNPAQFGDIDERVTPFVGTADDVAAAMGAHDGPGCVDTDHDVLARERARGTDAPAARTRGFVKVQDGCDCHCAYCIIPTVRGPARSRPASAILAEVRRARAQRPARDGDDGDQRGGLPRPRAGAGAGRADDGGWRACRASSGSGSRASRSSTSRTRCSRRWPPSPRCARTCTSRCSRATTTCCAPWAATTAPTSTSTTFAASAPRAPDVNVTTDVIVGFPTEDEAAFERTLDAVDAAQITRVHVFPYSPRPGTVAAELSATASNRPRRSAVPRCCGAGRSCAPACTAPPGWGQRSRC